MDLLNEGSSKVQCFMLWILSCVWKIPYHMNKDMITNGVGFFCTTFSKISSSWTYHSSLCKSLELDCIYIDWWAHGIVEGGGKSLPRPTPRAWPPLWPPQCRLCRNKFQETIVHIGFERQQRQCETFSLDGERPLTDIAQCAVCTVYLPRNRTSSDLP